MEVQDTAASETAYPHNSTEKQLPQNFSLKRKAFEVLFIQTFLSGMSELTYYGSKYPAEAWENQISKICMVAIFNEYLMESILQLPNADLACLKPLKRLSSPSENRSFCIEIHIKAPKFLCYLLTYLHALGWVQNHSED